MTNQEFQEKRKEFKMNWKKAIDVVQPHVVKIFTPQGSGTGFLVHYPGDGTICGIATAAHVVDNAHYWESPIRIMHYDTKTISLLRSNDRAIMLETSNDTAMILFRPTELKLPVKPLPLIHEGKRVEAGVEMGWLGFPAIAEQNLCFFSGRVSSWMENFGYLVDGVAINGVSGGPAFRFNAMSGEVFLSGVVSAYIANRATGDVLPGLCVVRDVSHFQKLIKEFKSVDEAKAKETLPSVPPPDKDGGKPADAKTSHRK